MPAQNTSSWYPRRSCEPRYSRSQVERVAEGSRLRKVAGETALKAVRLATSPRVLQLLGRPLIRSASFSLDDRGRLARARILVLKPDEIGDVVLATPFLRELRQLLPEADITLGVKPSVRNLVEHCPYVNEVIAVKAPLSMRWWTDFPSLWEVARFARAELWRRQLDIVLIPRWGDDHYFSKPLAFLSRAPMRLGFGSNPLLTHRVPEAPVMHEVERNLDMISALGGDPQTFRLETWLAESDESFAGRTLQDAGDSLTIAISPAARAGRRQWPLKNFERLAVWLNETRGARIVVLGGPGEQEVSKGIKRELGEQVVDLVGKATLRETVAILKRCHLFIGTDSGPAHLAAAVGTPCVVISPHPEGGSESHVNSPARFRPWGVPHSVLRPAAPLAGCEMWCKSEVPHCITTVSVEQVQEAVRLEMARDTFLMVDRAS